MEQDKQVLIDEKWCELKIVGKNIQRRSYHGTVFSEN